MVTTPGLYELDLSVAPAPGMPSERLRIVMQHTARIASARRLADVGHSVRRTLVVGHRRVVVRLRLRVAVGTPHSQTRQQQVVAHVSAQHRMPVIRAAVRRILPRAQIAVDRGGRPAPASPARSAASAPPAASSSPASSSPTPASAPAAAVTPRIAFGAYVSGVPDYPSLLDSFSSMVGRQPAVVLWYRYWGEDLFSTHDLQAIDSRGELPMVTWEPWNPDHTGVPLQQIASGADDATIRSDAQEAAAWGKPIFLRFAQEMNGDWYPWGLGVGGNTAGDFIAAWRHIVDVFRSAGASNVCFVWSPNETDSGTPGFTQLYPGDSYVDWVGIDAYNFGSTPNNTWQSFSQIFAPSYAAMGRLTDKPLMISETGSVEQGGSKAAWITSALSTEIPNDFPRVREVTWFDSAYNGLDWRVNSSSGALSAFSSAIGSPLYGLSGASLLAS